MKRIARNGPLTKGVYPYAVLSLKPRSVNTTSFFQKPVMRECVSRLEDPERQILTTL